MVSYATNRPLVKELETYTSTVVACSCAELEDYVLDSPQNSIG